MASDGTLKTKTGFICQHEAHAWLADKVELRLEQGTDGWEGGSRLADLIQWGPFMPGL